jgi:hypothetical protein
MAAQPKTIPAKPAFHKQGGKKERKKKLAMNVWVEAFGAAQGGMLGLIVTMPIETVQKTQVFRVDVFLHACKRCEAIRRSFARPCCTLMRQCFAMHAMYANICTASGGA